MATDWILWLWYMFAGFVRFSRFATFSDERNVEWFAADAAGVQQHRALRRSGWQQGNTRFCFVDWMTMYLFWLVQFTVAM